MQIILQNSEELLQQRSQLIKDIMFLIAQQAKSNGRYRERIQTLYNKLRKLEDQLV